MAGIKILHELPVEMRIFIAIEQAAVCIEEFMGIVAIEIRDTLYKQSHDWMSDKSLHEDPEFHAISVSIMKHRSECLFDCLSPAFGFFNGSLIYKNSTYRDDAREVKFLLERLMYRTLKLWCFDPDYIRKYVIRGLYRDLEKKCERFDGVDYINFAQAECHLNGFFREVLCHSDVLSVFLRGFKKSSDLCSEIIDKFAKQRNARENYILIKQLWYDRGCEDIATVVGPKLIQVLSGAGKIICPCVISPMDPSSYDCDCDCERCRYPD